MPFKPRSIFETRKISCEIFLKESAGNKFLEIVWKGSRYTVSGILGSEEGKKIVKKYTRNRSKSTLESGQKGH